MKQDYLENLKANLIPWGSDPTIHFKASIEFMKYMVTRWIAIYGVTLALLLLGHIYVGIVGAIVFMVALAQYGELVRWARKSYEVTHEEQAKAYLAYHLTALYVYIRPTRFSTMSYLLVLVPAISFLYFEMMTIGSFGTIFPLCYTGYQLSMMKSTIQSKEEG